MSLVTRNEPTEFDEALGQIVAFCPFCDAATTAESGECGVTETIWDVGRRCSHFCRFEDRRAVYEGPFDMLETEESA